LTDSLLELLSEFGVRDLYDLSRIPNPAAGANATYVFEQARAVRLLAARATVTTDANAANRIVSLDFLPAGAFVALRNLPAVAITASTTGQQVEWGTQYGQWDVNTNTPLVVPLTDEWMPGPLAVRFTLDNIQAGDTLTALSIVAQVIPAR